MKRKYPLRRTPLQRSTRIKKISERKRKEIEATRKIREIGPGELCEGCGIFQDCTMVATDCHEIPAGAHRHKAVYHRPAQMHLCRTCHETLQGKPYSYQVAIKTLASVNSVNDCCDRNAVCVADIIQELEEYENA